MDVQTIIVSVLCSTLGSIIGTYLCFWGYKIPVGNLRRLIHWKRNVRKFVKERKSKEIPAGVPLTPMEGIELENSRSRRILHR